MKTEKIIAAIEAYVNSLEKSDRDFFYKVSGDMQVKEGAFPIVNLAILHRDLKQDLKQECAKANKGASFASRQKLLQKLVLEKNTTHTEFQTGTWVEINGEKTQAFNVGGYYAFAFKDGSTFDIETKEKPSEEQLFKKAIQKTEGYRKINYDLSEITTFYKLMKADKKKMPTKVGNQWFNPEYFLNTVKILGGNVSMYQGEKMGINYFESENGFAILLPVKPSDKAVMYWESKMGRIEEQELKNDDRRNNDCVCADCGNDNAESVKEQQPEPSTDCKGKEVSSPETNSTAAKEPCIEEPQKTAYSRNKEPSKGCSEDSDSIHSEKSDCNKDESDHVQVGKDAESQGHGFDSRCNKPEKENPQTCHKADATYHNSKEPRYQNTA